MTRSSIRSYTAVAALALSSLFTFASEKPATSATPAPAKTEQICTVHPEYSCVEVPTAYGYESAKAAKQAKRQKAYARNAKSAETNGGATAAGQPQTGN